MKSEYVDLFDEYLSGSLAGQEKADLESRLETDLKLGKAFKEYKYLRNGIDYSIMKTLKEELQELEASLPDVDLEPDTKLILEQVSTPLYRTYWKIAAVIIVIAISAGVLFYQLIPPSSPQDLFSQYFEPYPNEFVSAKRGDDLSADIKVQSFQLYDAQNYASAIPGFETLLAEEESPLILFYLGCAQLHEDQTASAIDSFEKFLEISNDLRPEAKWYLALSYLKENRTEDARILLQELKDSRWKGKQAGRILKQLQ